MIMKFYRENDYDPVCKIKENYPVWVGGIMRKIMRIAERV